MFDELFDDITSVFLGDQRRIVFVCAPSFIPYEVVQYLEALGVACKPKAHVHIADDGTRTAAVWVSAGQYAWAAGLVAGMASGSVVVLEPPNVRPIAPRSSWGKPNRGGGLVASLLRGAAGAFGVKTRTPPARG